MLLVEDYQKMRGDKMKHRNFRKFENAKLQKSVKEEIEDRMRDSENTINSIIAFIAHNFNPTEKYKRDLDIK